MSLQSRIDELTFAARNPGKLIKQYKKESKTVIGCFPVYTPEELVYAGGGVPMGMWGAQTELSRAKQYLPAFACSIMQSTLELGLGGAYEGMNAVIIPSMCDTFKCMGNNWRAAVNNIPVIAFAHPQNRQTDAAMEYLETEYLSVKNAVEGHCDKIITTERMNQAIEVYNEHSAVMTEFAQLVPDHLDVINPIVRHDIFKSAWFMDKKLHTEAVREIIDELKKLPKYDFKGKKVVLTGILAEPYDLLQIMMDNDIAVVADDLAQESRQYRTPVPEIEGMSPIGRLARQWQNRRGCPLAFEEHKTRGQMLIDMVKNTDADAVIVCMMKFCDPEEYDYPVYLKQLNAEDIPSLQIEIDQQVEDAEQLRTRIQSFSEML